MRIRILLLIVVVCFVGCIQQKQAGVDDPAPYPAYDYDIVDATHFKFHVITSKEETETTFYQVADSSQLDDAITYIWYGYILDEFEDDQKEEYEKFKKIRFISAGSKF